MCGTAAWARSPHAACRRAPMRHPRKPRLWTCRRGSGPHLMYVMDGAKIGDGIFLYFAKHVTQVWTPKTVCFGDNWPLPSSPRSKTRWARPQYTPDDDQSVGRRRGRAWHRCMRAPMRHPRKSRSRTCRRGARQHLMYRMDAEKISRAISLDFALLAQLVHLHPGSRMSCAMPPPAPPSAPYRIQAL